MPVRNCQIEVAGELIAQLANIGDRYVLYSIHPALRILDGQVFVSPQAAREAAMAALDRRPVMQRTG